MSRKLFEYFFDPEELEPFYSELTRSTTAPQRSDRRPKEAGDGPTVSHEFEAAGAEDSEPATPRELGTKG